MELLFALVLGAEHFPVFGHTDVFRLVVVPKNLNSVYTCENGSFGYIADSKDLSHTKFIIHEAITEQIIGVGSKFEV